MNGKWGRVRQRGGKSTGHRDRGREQLGHRLDLHVAVLQLSLVIRLQQHGPDQLDDRRLAREDADHIGPPLDLLVEALERIGGVQLGPVPDGEGHVGQHVVLALVHEAGELGPAGAELIGHLPPDLAGRVLVGLQERLAERGGDHAVLALGHVGERVPHPVERQRCHAAPSTFAIAGLRPFMGVRDSQPDAP
jgi:hypothetical protein